MANDTKHKIIQGSVVINTLVAGNLMVRIKDEAKPEKVDTNVFRIINRPQMIIMPDNIVEGYLIKTTYTTNLYKDVRYAFFVTDNVTLRMKEIDFFDVVDIAVITSVNGEKEFLGKRWQQIPIDSLYAKGRETANAMLRYLCIYMILQFVRNPNEVEVCGRYNKKRMFNHAVDTVELACATYPKFKTLRDDIKQQLDRIYQNMLEYESQEELFPFLDNY